MKALHLKLTVFCLLSISLVGNTQVFEGPEEDLSAIRDRISSFSQAYMDGDIEALAAHYSLDAKILPPGADIIAGRAAIQNRWELPEGVNILLHKVTPSEIVVQGDTAWDYGYYEGQTQNKNGTSNWRGKYMIIWKKVEGNWLIYLDIWNKIDS